MSRKVIKFEKNTKGRDFVVGDIHGCFTKLREKMDEIGFDGKVDRMFSVGDLVDRGPESHEAAYWAELPFFFPVQGNHEDMAIRWPNGHMDAGNYADNGGSWNIGRTKEEQMLDADTFSSLPIAIEVETDNGLIGIVHAECPYSIWQDFTAALNNDEMPRGRRDALESACMWNRDRITSHNQALVYGVHQVIVGHTPVEKPIMLGNTLYIDTGAVWGRELTVIQIQ